MSWKIITQKLDSDIETYQIDLIDAMGTSVITSYANSINERTEKTKSIDIKYSSLIVKIEHNES
jgi:hypothetical protein